MEHIPLEDLTLKPSTITDIPITSNDKSESTNVAIVNTVVNTNEVKNESNEKVNPVDYDVKNPADGIINDIIHTFDDLYVYSRIHIENNFFNFSDNNDFNMIYPNLYVSNYSTCTNLELLQKLGITNIVTVLPTFSPPFPENFQYFHIPSYDDESDKLGNYFEMANKYIANVLENGGKVLIHCMVGRSRSVSILASFLLYIIKGKFNQGSLNIDVNTSADAEELEYEKLTSRNIVDGVKIKGSTSTTTTTSTITNSQQYVNDIINSNDGIIKNRVMKLGDDVIHSMDDNVDTPKIYSGKHNFILYKKQKMMQEIDDIIAKYKNILKDISLIRSCVGNDSEMSKYKETTAVAFFNNHVLAYIRKYRNIACPNDNFILQLANYALLE